jgi:hypothetical protein
LEVTAENPEQQQIVKEILESIKGPPVKSIDVKIINKKFLPYEVGLLIAVELAAYLSSDLIIAFLEKLWKKFTEKKIPVALEEIPLVQAKAESYLKSIGITSFETRDMVNGGLYASFVFIDKECNMHDLLISKTNLEVLKYSRRKPV